MGRNQLKLVFTQKEPKEFTETPGWPETKFGGYKARKGTTLQIILRNALRKTPSPLGCDPTSSMLLTLLILGFGYCLQNLSSCLLWKLCVCVCYPLFQNGVSSAPISVSQAPTQSLVQECLMGGALPQGLPLSKAGLESLSGEGRRLLT